MVNLQWCFRFPSHRVVPGRLPKAPRSLMRSIVANHRLDPPSSNCDGLVAEAAGAEFLHLTKDCEGKRLIGGIIRALRTLRDYFIGRC